MFNLMYIDEKQDQSSGFEHDEQDKYKFKNEFKLLFKTATGAISKLGVTIVDKDEEAGKSSIFHHEIWSGYKNAEQEVLKDYMLESKPILYSVTDFENINTSINYDNSPNNSMREVGGRLRTVHRGTRGGQYVVVKGKKVYL